MLIQLFVAWLLPTSLEIEKGIISFVAQKKEKVRIFRAN
jgi:hypothetical protein